MKMLSPESSNPLDSIGNNCMVGNHLARTKKQWRIYSRA